MLIWFINFTRVCARYIRTLVYKPTDICGTALLGQATASGKKQQTGGHLLHNNDTTIQEYEKSKVGQSGKMERERDKVGKLLTTGWAVYFLMFFFSPPELDIGSENGRFFGTGGLASFN